MKKEIIHLNYINFYKNKYNIHIKILNINPFKKNYSISYAKYQNKNNQSFTCRNILQKNYIKVKNISLFKKTNLYNIKIRKLKLNKKLWLSFNIIKIIFKNKNILKFKKCKVNILKNKIKLITPEININKKIKFPILINVKNIKITYLTSLKKNTNLKNKIKVETKNKTLKIKHKLNNYVKKYEIPSIKKLLKLTFNTNIKKNINIKIQKINSIILQKKNKHSHLPLSNYCKTFKAAIFYNKNKKLKIITNNKIKIEKTKNKILKFFRKEEKKLTFKINKIIKLKYKNISYKINNQNYIKNIHPYLAFNYIKNKNKLFICTYIDNLKIISKTFSKVNTKNYTIIAFNRKGNLYKNKLNTRLILYINNKKYNLLKTNIYSILKTNKKNIYRKNLVKNSKNSTIEIKNTVLMIIDNKKTTTSIKKLILSKIYKPTKNYLYTKIKLSHKNKILTASIINRKLQCVNLKFFKPNKNLINIKYNTAEKKITIKTKTIITQHILLKNKINCYNKKHINNLKIGLEFNTATIYSRIQINFHCINSHKTVKYLNNTYSTKINLHIHFKLI
ncbi:MAG: hypothetical protein Q8O27_00710 [Enterobacteriaceae bacterium]|nr:hypothetical protein [Enterobacteriaceae bacterium]